MKLVTMAMGGWTKAVITATSACVHKLAKTNKMKQEVVGKCAYIQTQISVL